MKLYALLVMKIKFFFSFLGWESSRECSRVVSEVQPEHHGVPGRGGEGGRQVLQRRGDQQDGLQPRQSGPAGEDDDSDARDERMVSTRD